MSFSTKGRRARTRALALLSAGAVVAGVLSGVPSAGAAGQPGAGVQPGAAGLLHATGKAPELGAGRYIVLMRAPAATAYRVGRGRPHR